MIKFLAQLLDLIYKKRCYFCSKSQENSKMCSSCYEKVNFLPCKILKKIEKSPVYSATIYEKEIKKMIRAIKYHNQKELAYFQAKLMYDYWMRLEVSKENYSIVPVPLFKKRQKKRKYNHMSLVAAEFSRLCGYEVKDDLIRRIKDTKPQYKLSIKEREENLHNAFEVDTKNYNGEKLLIIDDILTTGSTICEMIKTLKNSEITEVCVFVTSCTDFNLYH